MNMVFVYIVTCIGLFATVALSLSAIAWVGHKIRSEEESSAERRNRARRKEIRADVARQIGADLMSFNLVVSDNRDLVFAALGVRVAGRFYVENPNGIPEYELPIFNDALFDELKKAVEKEALDLKERDNRIAEMMRKFQ